jgi:hypothetical protein
MAGQLAEVTILGIRHHGPGSARSVARALEELQPDLLLVEGAPELDATLPFVGDDDLVPPVAGLIYGVGTPARATFYPLAVFSPEWVALRWAAANGVETHFADLPAANSFADPGEAEDSDADDAADRAQAPDAIGMLASAAGYADAERWWEDAVEHRDSSAADAFAQISLAMAEVRAGLTDDRVLLQREASMRLALRRAQRSGASRVVMVCGAYHAPALEPSAFPAKSIDEGLLAGLPKTKVAATWVPWTSSRLSLASGYGAGVASPGWYRHLFTEPGDVVSSWMAKVARALRHAELPASPASAVEAARLAETLAAVRGRPAAGLDEVTDAALAVLCEGSDLPLKLIESELVIGTELGEIPVRVPVVPLAADLARLQRSLRMTPSAVPTTMELDLRKETQLARSALLNRLAILGVGWGSLVRGRATTGTFVETWELEWRPELSVTLIEASIHGTTVEAAATAALIDMAADGDGLQQLGELVERALAADLPDALEVIVARLGERSAQQHDVLALLGMIEPLARTRRYGSVRGIDTASIGAVLEAGVARIAVGLRAASFSLDDDAAAAMRAGIESAERGIQLIDDAETTSVWVGGLGATAVEDRTHGSVAGRVTRMLLDRGELTAPDAGSRMARRLSAATDAPDGAAWLDGFLAGDARLLVHDRALLDLIDDWLTDLPERGFADLLPLVRRTFSAFSRPERRLIGERVAGRAEVTTTAHPVTDDARGTPALLRMASLLGLEVTG